MAVPVRSLPGDEIIIEPGDPVTDYGCSTNFGQAVALDHDMRVVDAPVDDVDPGVGDERGAVYVFRWIGDVGTQQAGPLVLPTLNPVELASNRERSHTLALSGQMVQ